MSEIENLYAKLYEDMTRKLITEKRFQMLSARYDSEQEELSAKIKELEKSATADREQLSSIEQFAEQISGFGYRWYEAPRPPRLLKKSVPQRVLSLHL